ncbi:unnamed protein product [Paramecium sonneborni]|uniref:PPM-type phosphatase domain-containing protein n=1 Tax=Paramecium sonneborni TaxID=65129 RepID=A0A8S1KR23_9CILI|nr:unnamed protein product [Paramecium sonneborni]
MSAQQKKLFLLKTKVGAISQQKQVVPQAITSRNSKLQRNSTRLPTLASNQLMYSPVVHTKQKTVLNISIVKLDDFHKNVVKYHSIKCSDGQDQRRYKIRNQDYALCKTKIGDGNGKHIFILNDGHGTSGLPIARFVGMELDKSYQDIITKLDATNMKDEKIHEEIIDLYKNTDELLSQQSDFNTFQSGTSNISLLIVGDQLLCINCGDSKALFYYKNDFQEQMIHLWRMKNLSYEHIPQRETELLRIKSNNGRIEQQMIRGMKQGNLQIWTKNKLDQGLHITRCFGNQLHKTVGVTVEPEIIHFKFPKSGYLVIGTSSLWNYLDNMDIGQILNKYNPPKSQSEIIRIENEILANAHHFWDGDHDGIQDISLMIIFIDLQL